MTSTAAAFSCERGARDAGREIARRLTADLGAPPDALIVFASPRFELEELLRVVLEESRAAHLVGCSSAGEFASDRQGEGAVSAMGIRSDEMEFMTCAGEGITADPAGAAEKFSECLIGRESRYPHRSILMLADALAGHTEQFIQNVNERSAGAYQIFGGGAGDDAKFQRTFVFEGEQVREDAAVGLVMHSRMPLGIGVRHGWEPAGAPMRATEADGFELVSLNGLPAVEAVEEHAGATGRRFDRADPIPFFLHNVLGIETPSGYKIRVPLGVTPRGGLQLATEIPEGATVRIMRATSKSAVEAAQEAAEIAMRQMGGHAPSGALFFDCVATRLRLGSTFETELAAVRDRIGTDQFVGCNSYGQVARVDGQFSGFHNCTAVVCVLPS
jgi:hypothetical protein